MRATFDSLARALTILSINLDRIGAWVVLPVVTAIIIMDVGLRYLLNDPTIWGLEFSQWTLLLIFVAAVPECTRRHGHIRMELVYIVMPPWARRIVTVAYSAVAMWVIWLLAVAEWEEMVYSLELDRVSEYLVLPYWIQHAAIVAMCAILLIFFALRLLGTILGHDPFPEEERGSLKLED